VAFLLHLVGLLAAPRCVDAALDSSGGPARDAQRRGAGWLPGLAASGGSHRRGWDAGCHLVMAVNPVGVSTGLACGAASTTDQPRADTGLAVRRSPHPRVPSVGAPALGPYAGEKGVEGPAHHRTWWPTDGAQVLCPPTRHSKARWPKALRRWRAGVRPLVETVDDTLAPTFRLDRERPHDLSGFRVRLAAKMALHNFCIWVNEHLGRPRLAFTDLVDW
jgi:hypothetical protein